MTLNEAIKRAEEVADAKLQDAELSEIQGCYNNAKKCAQCAEEHRQLAEWLKELKKLKEQTGALNKARAEIATCDSIWVEYSIPGHTDSDISVIVENVLKQAKEQVLFMIDKYRAESEE